MTREIGVNQRRILGILLERGKPMMPEEILRALAPAERAAWNYRQVNVFHPLAGLVRRGLVRREGGYWRMVDGTRRRLPLRFTVRWTDSHQPPPTATRDEP